MRAIFLGAAPVRSDFLKAALRSLGALNPKAKDVRIGIDGGVALWRDLGVVPHMGIGDWDSLKDRDWLATVPHLTLPRDKDRSDLHYALNWVEGSVDEIVALGVTGGRPDHHLASLMDLMEAAEARSQPMRGVRRGSTLKSVTAIGPEGQYAFVSERMGKWVSPKWKRGQIVSLFAMGGDVSGVTLKGFEYALKEKVLSPSSRALSNRVLKSPCTVMVKKGSLVVISPRDSHEAARKGAGVET